VRRLGLYVMFDFPPSLRPPPLFSFFFLLEGVREFIERREEEFLLMEGQFGVRVLLVEPGAFRSQFSAKLKVGSLPTPKEYAGTITEAMVQGVRDMAGTDGTYPRTMKGDVEKGVQAIFDVVSLNPFMNYTFSKLLGLFRRVEVAI
jgi:hypothetical protein